MSPLTDVALLLRVHAEHEWLQDELAVLLAQLEAPAALRLEELHAALAYLEVTWGEAAQRAARTDFAHERWERRRRSIGEGELGAEVRCYHRALLSLRTRTASRAEPFLGPATGAALQI